MPPSPDPDYECLSTVPDTRVRVRFAGPFQGRGVVWDMTLWTLARYRREHPDSGRSPARSFIEIHPQGAGRCRLEVALDLALIDEPAIRKTLVMIRNYRRLRMGRHEWGGERE